MVKQWQRETCDTRPLVARAGGRRIDEVAPGSDALDHSEEVANLGRFKRCTFDASFVEKRGGVKEAAELEAAAAREHGTQFRSALLLLVDPGEVGAGFERKHPAAAER